MSLKKLSQFFFKSWSPEGEVFHRDCDLRPLYPQILLKERDFSGKKNLGLLCEGLFLSYIRIFSERISYKKDFSISQLIFLKKVIDENKDLNWNDFNRIKLFLRRNFLKIFLGKIYFSLKKRKNLGSKLQKKFLLIVSDNQPEKKFVEIINESLCYETGLFFLQRKPIKYFIDPVILLVLSHVIKINQFIIFPPKEKFVYASIEEKKSNIFDVVDVLKKIPSLPLPLAPRAADDFSAKHLKQSEEEKIKEDLNKNGWAIVPEFLDKKYPFILTLRHDVDRVLEKNELLSILKILASLDIRSSWYFRRSTYDTDLVKILLDQGHEVGYHADHALNGDFGFGEYLKKTYKEKISGVTFHGGSDSSYWNGLPSLKAVAGMGYEYAENLCEWFPYPYRELSTGLFLTSLPYKIESRPEWVRRHLKLVEDYRGHLVFENHPDFFGRSLPFFEKLLQIGPVSLKNDEVIHQKKIFDNYSNFCLVEKNENNVICVIKNQIFNMSLYFDPERVSVVGVEGGEIKTEMAEQKGIQKLYIRPVDEVFLVKFQDGLCNVC